MEKLLFRLFVKGNNDRLHAAALDRIRERGIARVALITSSLSMWRLEGVWRMMQEDPAFDCRIILVPFAKLSTEDRQFELGKLREYFDSKGIAYFEQEEFQVFDPDIVFYQQFYSRSYEDPIRARLNEHRLLCYAPYGVMFINKKWQYDSRFHRVAWKIYMQSEAHRKTSRRMCANSAENVVVVGDADYDAFAAPAFDDPWKKQEAPKRRIIWAPHHKRLGRDSFEWTAEEMKRIATDYADRCQFAFKPHPHLKTDLIQNPSWGPSRTDSFYEFWEKGENTQLETGSFIELFRGSDAMVHDCNSFIAEYLYTRKPVLFLSRHAGRIRSTFGRFGKDALDAHYIGRDTDAIRAFIDKTVLGGEDPKKPEREHFHNAYLKPSDDRGFAEKIVEDIRQSILAGPSEKR